MSYILGLALHFFLFVSQGEAETSRRRMRVIHFVVDKHISEVNIEDLAVLVEGLFPALSQRCTLALVCMLTC
jgi:hypothetical protein